MKRLNLKIGSKIAISAGIGILLVAGMVAGQHFSNAAIAVEAAFVNQNHFNKADAMAGAAAVQLNYVAVASIPSAWPAAQVDKILETLRTGTAEATRYFDRYEPGEQGDHESHLQQPQDADRHVS